MDSIRKVIRNKRLLSVLESQYSSNVELGVEFVNSFYTGPDIINEIFRVYTRRDGRDWSEERFVIQRVRKNGKLREYLLEGKIYFNQ